MFTCLTSYRYGIRDDNKRDMIAPLGNGIVPTDRGLPYVGAGNVLVLLICGSLTIARNLNAWFIVFVRFADKHHREQHNIYGCWLQDASSYASVTNESLGSGGPDEVYSMQACCYRA